MKMKKLIFSVFALSALMLSACSGGTVEDTSSTEPAPATSSTPAPSSSGAASSSDESSSTSAEPVVLADYRVKIGTTTYDLVEDTAQLDHDKQYYFGADVTKAVAKGDAVIFQQLVDDEYAALNAKPSDDDTTGLIYNNVEDDGENNVIMKAGNVQVYLKLDDTSWTYWITGGDEMPETFYTDYKLAYGANDEAQTWSFQSALAGTKYDSEDENVARQIKYTITVPAGGYGFKIRNYSDDEGAEWYGDHFVQEAYRRYDYDPQSDRNIHLSEGTYDVYFKLLKDGSHAIWVAKDEANPDTFAHLYVSLDGVNQELAKRDDPVNGWKQFYVENIALTKDSVLGVWTENDTDPSHTAFSLIQNADNTTKLIMDTSATSMSNPTFKVNYAGNYSFYFNEEANHILSIYTVLEGGIPTTNVLFDVVYNTVDGESLYVVGDFSDWKAIPEYKLHWKEGNHWVVDTSDATKGFALTRGSQFKLVVAATNNPGETGYVWEAGKNRKVAENMDPVNAWTVDTYTILLEGASNPVTFANVTEEMEPDNNKYAEYKATVTAEALQSFVLKLNGESFSDGDHKTYTGNVADQNFEVAGESDVYLKLYHGDGQHSDEIYYVVWASTPAVVHTYAATINTVAVSAADLEQAAIAAGDNVWAYEFELSDGDVIAFTDNTAAMQFVHWDTDHAVEEGTTLEADADGIYRFFYKEGQGIYHVFVPAPVATTVKFNVTYDTTSAHGEGYSLYVVGTFNDWTPTAEYKLHWTTGNVWVVDPEDADAGFSLTIGDNFKIVVAPTANPSKATVKKWEGDPNRVVTADMVVSSWQD